MCPKNSRKILEFFLKGCFDCLKIHVDLSATYF